MKIKNIEEYKNPKYRDCYFRMTIQPNSLLSSLLAESYKRNSYNVDWFSIFKHLRDFGEDKTQKLLDEKFVNIEVVNSKNCIGGYFDLSTRKVVIVISLNLYHYIFFADDLWLKNLANNFWVNFVHEDTHRQQYDSAKGFDIFKHYKKSTVKDWNEDLENDFDYFNQQIEADAYGREIAARLQEMTGESSSEILLNVNSNSVKDAYSKKIINVYKDPRIDRKVSNSFFRALYDYFVGNEL